MITKKKKVLVADDDLSVLEVLRIMLEYSNYRVKTVQGHQVLPEVKHEKPDVVVMDISMPKADGRDVCKKLKSSSETKDVPVILISAAYNMGYSSHAAGADEFIAKPFDMNDLLHKVALHARGA